MSYNFCDLLFIDYSICPKWKKKRNNNIVLETWNFDREDFFPSADN